MQTEARMGKPFAVLIVEDDPDLARGLRRILQLDQYHVELAGSIAEMMNRADWSPFFAVLLDRKLPDGSAEQALPELRTRAPEAAIIMITGHSDLPSTIASFRAGVEDYLIKPVEPEMLRNCLRRVVKHRLAQEALRREEAERKKAEDALRESEAELRAILDAAADAIISVDAGATVHSVNLATEKMFGYPAAEIIGRNIQLLLPESFLEEQSLSGPALIRSDAEQMPSINRETVARRKDGSQFFVELALSEVNWVNRFTMVLRDITRRKILEREVVEIASREQRRIGEELHDSVGQELTALNILAADLAQSLAADPASGRKLVERMIQGLRRSQASLRAIMRGLLPVAIDSEGLMASLSDLADRVRLEGKVDCIFDCPEPVNFADNLTATQLYLIAQEAVHNALKHARARHIRISLVSGKMFVLTVQDDGIGMPARSSEKHDGLGQQIMRNRAAIIGAAVTIRSVEPAGTLVRCEIDRRKIPLNSKPNPD
jgi:PAS domain S-box-containing protein